MPSVWQKHAVDVEKINTKKNMNKCTKQRQGHRNKTVHNIQEEEEP